MLESARLTPTSYAFPFGCDPTVWANLGVSVAEVLAVLFAVAGDAQRRAVRGIKSQFKKVRERLEVMRVQVNASGTTSLAGVVVPLEYGFAPLAQLVTHPGAFAIKRPAVFPCTGQRTDLVSLSTFPRAVDALSIGPRLECLPTVQAGPLGRSVRPAHLAAVLRCFSTICVHLVRFAADGAGESGSGLSGGDRSSLDRWHSPSITRNDPAYCDVIVKRWENHTGLTATLEAAR